MTRMLPEDYVGLYLAYPNDDGSATQKIWLFTPESAKLVEKFLGADPAAEIIITKDGVQAAGNAAIEHGAQMFTPLDET